jgi:hypothetical protein
VSPDEATEMAKRIIKQGEFKGAPRRRPEEVLSGFPVSDASMMRSKPEIGC